MIVPIRMFPYELSPALRSSRMIKPYTYRRDHPKVGRNEPCPCGSGLKFKKCCLKGGDTNEGGDS